MTIQEVADYVNSNTGFIMLVYNRVEDPYKIPIVGFTNKSKTLLTEIENALLPAAKGCIVTRVGGFMLHYTYNSALEVCKLLQQDITHKTKRDKVDLLLSTYKEVTPRNGKYSPEMRARKLAFENAFEAIP